VKWETFDAAVDDVYGLTCAHQVALRGNFAELMNDSFHGLLSLTFIIPASSEDVVFECCGHICRMSRQTL